MQEIIIEYEERVEANKKLRYEVEEKRIELQEVENIWNLALLIQFQWCVPTQSNC